MIGNYSADQQQSMTRFAELLACVYEPHARVSLVRPSVLLNRIPGLPRIARKYIGYIDKLLIFPLLLFFRARCVDLVHIADHGNAFYSFFCPRQSCVVTCHDLLAVRGAMGDTSLFCPPSPIGIWLQRLILAGLRRSAGVAFVSQATYSDFQRYVGITSQQHYAVIHNSLNAPFSPDASEFHLSPDDQRRLPTSPYLLMVGSAHPRKNRVLALRVLQQLGPTSPYRLVFAGAPLAQDEQAFIASHHLTCVVVSIVRPSHALLNHLYASAHALLFPSHGEGFGWPLIEAQACGCPVIASTTTSIPEVAGSAALYAGPNDVSTFTSHVLALEDPALRGRLIRKGVANLRRFDPEVISRQYLNFALQPPSGPA